MGRLDDMQTVLKVLRKSEKIEEKKCVTILGLAESFKTMNWPDPA